MNNLEKIKAAYAMGWAAQIEWHGNEDLVVALYKDGGKNQPILLRSALLPMVDSIEQSIKITCYLYAGLLAGNEPVPDKKRFKIKQTGEIDNFATLIFNGLSLEEIEPVFD